MNKAAVILLLLFTHPAFAQQKQVSFNEIDYRVKGIEPASPADLAQTLTAGYTTEREKIRAIFSWITEHISYRIKSNYNNRRVSFTGYSTSLFTDTAKWKTANDIVAETVLKNQSAVCDGYARLFKTLCDYAGLRSAIITGYAKTDMYRKQKFGCNHTWNAVYSDSAWRLLDVTWASGYTSYRGDEFIKHSDDYYFLTPPEDFIRDHFPDDMRWSLLEKLPLLKEFQNSPYKCKSFGKYKIVSYLPASGIIEAAVGDTLQIALETSDPKTDKTMAADTSTVFDNALQNIFSSVVFLQPGTDAGGKKLLYTYIVESAMVEWLQVTYNKDAILRYHVRIKKDKNSVVVNIN